MFNQMYFENNWYYSTSGSEAFEDLRRHGKDITFLIPFWFGVTESGTLVDRSDAETVNLARRQCLPVIAIVHNYSSREYGPLIHRLLTTENLRRTLVVNIKNLLINRGFSGVNIDFEFVPPEDRPYLNTFMFELYYVLKPYGFLVTISVPPELRDDPAHPFSGAFSYPDLALYSDQVYVLAYDEHVAEPGPIASIDFVRQILNYALSVIPRQKLRMGMAVYGRDWSPRTELPRELSYREAVNLAARQGAVIRYDEKAQEPTFTYTQNGVKNIVWFEDARSFEVKLNLFLKEKVPGIGVWRVSLEDPQIWDLLPQYTQFF